MKAAGFISCLLVFLYQPLSAEVTGRWYTQQQVDQGKVLFQKNCASCHGQNADSTPHWKQTDANGNYPPPPLNGTAHTWHHDLPLLQRTIREGGQKLGGQMPPFESVLKPQQIDSVIAFFQSKWPNDIYTKWAGRFKVKATPPSLFDLKSRVQSKPDISYLKQRLGNIDIGKPEPSGIDRLYKIKFKNKTLFLTEDGQYAIIGDMIDLKKGINLTK